MDRRAYAGLLAAGLVFSLLLAACGGGDPTPTPRPAASTPTSAGAPTMASVPQPTATRPPAATATPAPVADREMRVALALIDFSLLPEQGGHARWQDPLYDYFIGVNAAGALDSASGVVSSWQSSPDFRTWTFNMRKGVLFHNRVEAAAKDFKWTLDFNKREGAITSGADYLRQNVTVEAVDASTVVIRLKDPNFNFAKAWLTPLGSGVAFYLLPKDYMESIGHVAFNKAPIGSGPYKLSKLELAAGITYEAVDSHWYQGKPKFKTLQFIQIAEEPTRVALLRAGRAEVIELGRARGAELRKAGFNVFVKEGSDIGNVYLHEQYKQYDGVPNPLGNVKVREALNLAVDRQAIVDTYMSGLARPTVDFPVVSWDPAYQKVPLPKFDPERAKQLLKEAGYPNGFEVEVHIYPFRGIPEGPEIMEGVAVWWERIGVKVNRKPTEYTAFRQPWFTQGFTRPTASGILPINNRTVAVSLAGSASKATGTRIAEDAELEALQKQWLAAVSEEEYIRIGRLVQQKWTEKWIYVTLFEMGQTWGADPKAVPSWTLGRSGESLRINSIAAGK